MKTLNNQLSELKAGNITALTSVNDLSNVAHENKTQEYVKMAGEFYTAASEIASNSESFITKKATNEIGECLKKARNADCEYTAYVNANAAEKWLEKIITRKFF